MMKRGREDGGKKWSTRRRTNGAARGSRGGEGSSVYLAKEQRRNEEFESYVMRQRLVADTEWEQFWAVARSELPLAFRVSASTAYVKNAVVQRLQTELQPICENTPLSDGRIARLEPISWYPRAHEAWLLDLPRGMARESQELAFVQHFMVVCNETAAICRQELVSMVPPLMVDIAPHHRVLDMCASPGSKSSQVLELLHAEGRSWPPPDGFLVANDVDEARCYTLVHQLHRMGSPCWMATNYPAQRFPPLYDSQGQQVLFDRVLCDVPCSGDGTMRKNPQIWLRWMPNNANGLHSLQLAIAAQGARYLKVGGQLVYSTCSMNPVENEAVVAELIRSTKGALRLVDCAGRLPGLVRVAGLKTWQVYERSGKASSPDAVKAWYERHEDVPEERKDRLRRSLFPPDSWEGIDMERAMRIYPHFQNTGAFFIAVLEKVAPLPWEHHPRFVDFSLENKETPLDESEKAEKLEGEEEEVEEALVDPSLVDAANQVRTNTKSASSRMREEPYLPLAEATLEAVARSHEKFGLDGLPGRDRLLMRSDKAQKLYLLNPTLASVLFSPRGARLRVVNAGLRAFERWDTAYRLTHDACAFIGPMVKLRRLELGGDALTELLLRQFVRLDSFAEPLRSALIDVGEGSVVFVARLDDQPPIYLAGWRGLTNASLMINKQEAEALALLWLSREKFADAWCNTTLSRKKPSKRAQKRREKAMNPSNDQAEKLEPLEDGGSEDEDVEGKDVEEEAEMEE